MKENTSCKNAIDKTDWGCIWQQQMESATFGGNGADFWNNWAKSLPAKLEHSGYVEEVLNRIHLSPEYSLLDVGAGAGTLAIPLARKVRRVTALDRSPYMLDIILQKAEKENISNIITTNINWAKAGIGKDVEKHDVVLVSRSLPYGENITDSLKLINSAARHSCYITWKADSHDKLEYELCNMLGIEYRSFPDYIVLCNMLYNMGIRSNVELFKTSGQRFFRSLEEAYIQIVRSHPVKDGATKQRILDFLNSKLTYEDDLYSQQKDVFWALVWWEVE